jgi:hypothetical protein
MHAEQRQSRTQHDERKRPATLDAWPLPVHGADPDGDEPLDREGDDEPITEKVPADPGTASRSGRR